jgi:hypothetical protein
MKARRDFVRVSGQILLPGLFLALLVSACSTAVDVKCGPKGMGAADRISKPTGCYRSNYTGSADNFWDVATWDWVPVGSGYTCTGKKCNNNPGTCGGVQCVTYYDAGSCYCSCAP